MKVGIAISTLFLMASTVSQGQNVPTPTASVSASPGSGSSLPSPDGTIHYALSASELVLLGYYGPSKVTAETALSGDVSYNSPSAKAPFSLLFAGGVLISESSGVGTTTFQNLAVSQSLMTGKWVLGITDSVSYLPRSPTTGLSGIAGVGDIGALPVQGPSAGPAGGVLTTSGSLVANSLSGSVERLITGKTSVSGSGSWSVLHFLNNTGGLDNATVTGQVALNHRIDARDSVSANAVYSIFTFGALQGGLSFSTRGVNGVYSRVLSRSFSVSASAGPQWVASSNSALIPNRLDMAANVGLSYSNKLTYASVGYSRGVNGGSGVQLGALSDTVSASVGHPIGRDWLTSASGAYSHASGLVVSAVAPPSGGGGAASPLTGNFSTVYGGVQVSHRLGRHFSTYGSYTAQHQTYDAAFTGINAFSGTSHTFGIGISFTPQATRLGQF
jgi:hypothetical protein